MRVKNGNYDDNSNLDYDKHFNKYYFILFASLATNNWPTGRVNIKMTTLLFNGKMIIQTKNTFLIPFNYLTIYLKCYFTGNNDILHCPEE